MTRRPYRALGHLCYDIAELRRLNAQLERQVASMDRQITILRRILAAHGLGPKGHQATRKTIATEME